MMGEMLEMPTQKTPVTIFSGFLGSGKTTLISHLIDQLVEKNVKVAYIKNEIGDESVDSKIIQGKNIQTQELLNGCICCTLVGPFTHALTEIIDTLKPERILIEASGAADPSAIALMVSSHPLVIRDGVITLIDVENFEGYKDLSETARHQAMFTDLIVFNKVDEVDLERKKRVVGYVRELNEFSPILEARGGKIAAELIFGAHTHELAEMLQHEKSHSHHLDHDGLESFSCELDCLLEKEKLIEYLENLPSSVIRVKGFVPDKRGGKYLNINKVGKRVDIEEFNMAESESQNQNGKLVFIGFHIENLQKSIRESFYG